VPDSCSAGHPPLASCKNAVARGGIRDGVPRFIIVDERTSSWFALGTRSLNLNPER
jgi:hypothetical protein